jgi:hypothetical protein
VAREEKGAAIAELGGEAVALLGVEGKAGILVVVGDAAVEGERVLLAHLQAAVLAQGEGRGMGHVGVEDAHGLRRLQVDAGMDEERRGLDLVLTLEDIALGIAQQERGGGDLRPMEAVRIDEEAVTADLAVLVGHGKREVVAHPFLHPEPRRPAQGAREIDPLLLQAHPAHPPSPLRRLADLWQQPGGGATDDFAMAPLA